MSRGTSYINRLSGSVDCGYMTERSRVPILPIALLSEAVTFSGNYEVKHGLNPFMDWFGLGWVNDSRLKTRLNVYIRIRPNISVTIST